MATYTENEYRGVSLKMDGVFISPIKSTPTPSELDCLDSESENMLRILGCESIQDAGKLLKLPQVAVACAQVLYHRFYFSKSFVRYNWEHYAMACVFLSAKIEESCRRLRDVVTVFVHLRQLREQSVFKPLPIPEYAVLKPHIIKAERRILKELGFCVHGKHPHKLICIYLHFLGQTKNIDLAQLSWNYMNDSLRTTVFVCYHPETIACACIYLAGIHLQFPLGTKWFEIFNVSEETIQTICLSILQLYALNKPDVVELEKRVAQLRKAQIEARNEKIAQEKELQDIAASQANSYLEKSSKKSDNRDSLHAKRDSDIKGKENLDKNPSHRKKSHKSRKSQSPSPRYERRYRSRSAKKVRDHSQEKKRNHKKYSGGQVASKKEHNCSDKKYRRSFDSDDDYSSDKRRRVHNDYANDNGGGGGARDYFKQKQGGAISPPRSSSSERRYSRKRQRSSGSPPPQSAGMSASVVAPVTMSSSQTSKSVGGGGKHASRKVQNGSSSKMYR